MSLDFRIVLFEHEAYATEKGEKGVHEILTEKLKSGCILQDDTYFIYVVLPHEWKWWLKNSYQPPEHDKFYGRKPPSWYKEDTIYDRVAEALKEWQKVHVKANQEIQILCSGKYYLYHCRVEKVCGNAEIYCLDCYINQMSDHAYAEKISGNTTINRVMDKVKIQTLCDNSVINCLGGNALISCMKGESLVKLAVNSSRINTMKEYSRILTLTHHAHIHVMKESALINWATLEATIHTVSSGCAILGLTDKAKITNVHTGALILPLCDYSADTSLPFE